MKMFQDSTKKETYAPFADHDEWELAWWLIKTVNQRATDEFLKLPITRDHMRPIFSSSHTFLKLIDHNASDGPLANDTNSEELELWMKDPVTCVRELIGNPAFDDSMMWTGDWWWQTQEHLPSGATIVPVIIASDKTHLSRFKGDKTAWLVYLSIGNLSKQVRCEPSRHGAVLLGYLPVSKLTLFEDNSIPLVAAGQNGVQMIFFPILTAYIGDHPKQCLIACYTENRCPKCVYPPSFIAEGLQPVFSPFWADLPHTDIFIYISSDILHQLHQGLFKDYLKKWCTTIAGLDDFDAWFHAMSIFPGLQYFNDDILQIRQWTSTNHKQLQQVFIGGLIGITTKPHILQAAYSLTDFICLAQYQSHTDKTIQALLQALDDFHGAKDVFIELGLCEHFNIPKVHSLLHYINMIKNLRSLNRYLIWCNSTADITPLTRGSGNNECGPCASSIHVLTLAEPVPTHTLYHIALKPHLPKKTVQYLEQYYGAVSFLPALKDFLGIINSEHQFCILTIHDRFDIFTNLVLLLPPNEHVPFKDHSRICAHPLHLNGTRKPSTLARFDMVLMTNYVDLSDRETLHSLHMAEVRIFFTLPSHLGTYHQPLIYVHWFKPMRMYDNHFNMFHLSRSTRQWIPNTEVILVDQIVQQYHLIPSFPCGAINPQWIQGHALVEAQYFYLNKYIDLHTFEQNLNVNLCISIHGWMGGW
ncbi:hypothetical protein HD554DRAFT_2207041 [Boletus coccyginus]|nr:hypothetical protein HD554DRAFT_2207041 [Boletus coccyginus]